VVTFLAFHAHLADRLARAIADRQAGREQDGRQDGANPGRARAEAAVIAWMRHQTTGYEGMVIPRVKRKRREVRCMLAERSQELLQRYRRREPGDEYCPLERALEVDG
jgi:hypothetical protein